MDFHVPHSMIRTTVNNQLWMLCDKTRVHLCNRKLSHRLTGLRLLLSSARQNRCESTVPNNYNNYKCKHTLSILTKPSPLFKQANMHFHFAPPPSHEAYILYISEGILWAVLTLEQTQGVLFYKLCGYLNFTVSQSLSCLYKEQWTMHKYQQHGEISNRSMETT